MGQISVVFNANSAEELQELLSGYMAHGGPPSWLGKSPPPSDAKAVADAETLSDEDYDVRYSDEEDTLFAPVPMAEPEPQPVKTPRKPRAPRAVPAPDATILGNSVPMPEPVSEPIPAPPAPSAPLIELPQLDALKQTVTLAVRQAQKGEGSRQILDLLPGFKSKTNLAFVMEATDAHRQALYDLIQAAGLSPV